MLTTVKPVVTTTLKDSLLSLQGADLMNDFGADYEILDIRPTPPVFLEASDKLNFPREEANLKINEDNDLRLDREESLRAEPVVLERKPQEVKGFLFRPETEKFEFLNGKPVARKLSKKN